MDDRQTITASALTIHELCPGEDASAFRTLNEEWISRYFVLEDKDVEQLSHPEELLRRGGHIYFALHGGETVGCAALLPQPDGVYELSKMAVAPAMRGRGIGRVLIAHLIAEARRLGAQSLFLGSSTKLPSAVHLYESSGFRHTAPEQLPKLAYTRADVFMHLDLQASSR